MLQRLVATVQPTARRRGVAIELETHRHQDSGQPAQLPAETQASAGAQARRSEAPAPEPAPVRADAARLTQALSGLLTHAVASAHTVVSIAVLCAGGDFSTQRSSVASDERSRPRAATAPAAVEFAAAGAASATATEEQPPTAAIRSHSASGRTHNRRLGDRVRIEIAHDGPCLPAATVKQLLHPFAAAAAGDATPSLADAAAEHNAAAAGLGLAVAAAFIELMGGRVGVAFQDAASLQHHPAMPTGCNVLYAELPRAADSDARRSAVETRGQRNTLCAMHGNTMSENEACEGRASTVRSGGVAPALLWCLTTVAASTC